MKFHLTKLFVLIILLFSIFSSCSNNNTNELKIGVILPMTGKLSFMGEQEKNGMLIAQEKINLSNKKIKLIFEDSKSNAKDGVNAARKLLTVDKVDILLTSTTGVSLAVVPIAESNKVDMVAFCMEPEIAKKSIFLTRLYEGVTEEAQAFVDYIDSAKSIKKIGILYNKVEAWEKVVNDKIKPSIQDNGISLVFEEQYPVGEKDLRNIVTKLKNAKPGHLILLSYGFEFPSLLPLFAENKIIPGTKILGGWGFLYPNVGDSLLEDILVSGPEYVFRKDSLALEFSKLYLSKYGKESNYDAAMAYNTIDLISSYYDSGKIKSGIRFKDLIKNKSILQSVVGPYEINNDGEMIIKTSLGVYKKGVIMIDK